MPLEKFPAKLAAHVFDQSAEGIMVVDHERRIVLVNASFSRITGYPADEVIGQRPSMLSSGRHDGAFYAAMWDAIEAGGRWEGEIWNRRKNGEVYPEHLAICRVDEEPAHQTHYIGTFSDLSDLIATRDKIDWLAHFDSLTGLPNRLLAADRTTQSMSMMQRQGEPLTLMVLDIDHFKNVNDALGHRVGDGLLNAVAERLTEQLRDQDTVARLGADEFMLVLPATDIPGAAHLSAKLSEALARPFMVGRHELRMTASIGIAMFPADAMDFERLAICANVALQRAKADGRNTCRFFTHEMQLRSARRILLEGELRRAIERNEMSVHFQPQVSLVTGRVTGAEALLRWNHAVLGQVPPSEFIPIAEASGQILQLGGWVLRHAVRHWKRWIDGGSGAMTLAVNLSALQFQHPGLIDSVTAVLDEEGLPARYLELELTEGMAMDDPLGAIATMNRLHALGVRMSIDDFGTGYSSLSYLKRFKVSKLKIDQSFVRDVAFDPDNKAIVGAIINLANNLGLKTVAEGVETAEQLALLRSEGCDSVQGYLFSKPLAPEQFEQFLRAQGSESLLSARCYQANRGSVAGKGEVPTYFAWSDALSVGNEAIDNDHRTLIAIIDGLYTAIELGKGDAVVDRVLDALIRYTEAHFRREEELMLQSGYDGYDAHKREHDQLVATVRGFQTQFQSGVSPLTVQMLTFLFDWLFKHILCVDKQLAGLAGTLMPLREAAAKAAAT